MSREQSTVEQQSASSNPEPVREYAADQPAQVDGRRHKVLPANREGDLTTSSIQTQGREMNLSQVNPDQGIGKKLYILSLSCNLAALFDLFKSKMVLLLVFTQLHTSIIANRLGC